jgi:hypothetical protein
MYFSYKGFLFKEMSFELLFIPTVAEKNILILVEKKYNNLIQSFCHIT